MNEFDQGTLNYLNSGKGKYYVYALAENTGKGLDVFYIGKGEGNRVFSHQKEAGGNPKLENEKVNRIRRIENNGGVVIRLMICWHLTEDEAFAAESAMINLLNFLGKLTNIVSGHGSAHEAYEVKSFAHLHGAQEIDASFFDKDDKIIAFKINRTYKANMSDSQIYDIVRGYWGVNMNRVKDCNTVLAVYNGIVLGVYKNIKFYESGTGSDWPNKEKYKTQSECEKGEPDRRYFVGTIDTSSKYIGKSIKRDVFDSKSRAEFRYIN